VSGPEHEPPAGAAELRYERERAFHDARFADDDRSANRFYPLMQAADEELTARLDATPEGSDYLEYGCGADASTAIHLARQGRHVVAVDLSEVAIASAAQAARSQGVDGQIDFRVMNAEALELEDDSFDAACGVGVLHHLNLERAYAEVARVLKPGGRALFLEPMGHNPLINLYRRRTPSQRTPDEHPLLTADLKLAERYFGRVETAHFALASLAAVPFAQTSLGRRALGPLEAADRALFRALPSSRKFGWLVVMDLIDPRPAPQPPGA
jgi:SAM-dependent methyltransferase